MKFNSCSIAGPKGDNQDALLLPFDVGDYTWCAIADGVGSSMFGGLAAQTSLEVVKEAAKKEALMVEVFAAVRRKLDDIADEQRVGKSISTTLSVLRISGNMAFVGHVGDTRISHYRGSGVMGRTKDQTEVQKLLDDGVLSKNQAARYPRRNVLLSAMSAGREYDLHEQEFSIEPGDRILLTTDGFHNKIARRWLAEVSSLNANFDDFWSAIYRKLSSEVLNDDASCIALEVG